MYSSFPASVGAQWEMRFLYAYAIILPEKWQNIYPLKLFILFLRLICVTVTTSKYGAAISGFISKRRKAHFMHLSERKEGNSLKTLVIKARKGDARAFIRLIDMNTQSMYKIARSYLTSDEDIADAIQDTIETCYRTIARLEDADYFRTWLTRILINKCIDIIRKNRRERPVSEFPEYGEVSTELSNCEFNDLMNTLDEKYRTILLLYYGEGFKISEIARLLDMEENTVKTRLSRGRRKFRDIWTAQDAVQQN